MNSQQASCNVCNEVFDDEEKMVNSNGQLYHENCFVWVFLFHKLHLIYLMLLYVERTNAEMNERAQTSM